ncbi:MAG: hypothetical protein U9R05_11425 [Chloroflexota bacterium]|nr:hypothetical protein [Chloroflexota bacterium]
MDTMRPPSIPLRGGKQGYFNTGDQPTETNPPYEGGSRATSTPATNPPKPIPPTRGEAGAAVSSYEGNFPLPW